MEFKIALTNVFWTADYQNARRFGSRAEQEQYFDVNTLFSSDVPTRNVDFQNLTRMSIYVKAGEAGVTDALQNNYAIIKELKTTPKYWYYFITNATFDSVTQIRLDLQLDVIQTYYIDMTFNESMIERAHLNRWTNSGVFSRAVDNPLFTRDDMGTLPKRIKTSEKAKTSPFAPTHPVSQWLDANVNGWVYAFLDTGSYQEDATQAVYDVNMEYMKLYDNAIGAQYDFYSPYIVICAPLIKNSNYKISTGYFADSVVEMDINRFWAFVRKFASNIYAIKLSAQCPFSGGNYQYSIDEIAGTNATRLTIYGAGCPLTPLNGLTHYIRVQYFTLSYLTKSYTLPQTSITKSSIDTYLKDLNANPKIYGMDVRELKLVYGGGEFSFDIQKLYASTNGNDVVFRYFEILTPEIAPAFITIDGIDNGLYNDVVNSRFGYLAQNDFTMPYSKNQLDSFLANNKNFFMQKNASYEYQRTQQGINSAFNAISGAAGAIGAGAAGDIGGAVRQAASATMGIAQGIISNELSIKQSKLQMQYSIDNMRAGVDALANSNSNALFMLAINDVSILIQELCALPVDELRYKEVLHHNGYVLNIEGNVKDYDNIRTNWNYVKAEIDVIKTPLKIPADVRNTIKAIFAQGIRFWNTDNITYHQTNLEVTA